jgi:hypothetical protein
MNEQNANVTDTVSRDATACTNGELNFVVFFVFTACFKESP